MLLLALLRTWGFRGHEVWLEDAEVRDRLPNLPFQTHQYPPPDDVLLRYPRNGGGFSCAHGGKVRSLQAVRMASV